MTKIIGGIIVAVLFVVGFLVWQGKSQPSPAENANKPPQEGKMMEQGMGMISSIKDAMGLGKAMQCSYVSDAQGQSFQSEVVVNGEKFKSTTTMNDMVVYAVFDGENQYTWMSNSQQGMKMSKDCLEKMKEMAKNLPATNDQVPLSEDVAKSFDGAKNVSCTVATNTDMSVPKDIIFTDQCAMMEESMKMMEQMKDKMPAGMTMPALPNAAY